VLYNKATLIYDTELMIQTVILAGGAGTRLRPLTKNIPKPMALVAGRPFLEYQIEMLRENGLTSLLFLIGYRGEQISSHFGDGKDFGVRITYSQEPEPLGSGGALKLAYQKLESSFLLLYGDSYLSLDYRDFIQGFVDSKKKAAVGAYHYRDAGDRGDDARHNLCINKNGVVLRFAQNSDDEDLNYVESGVMALKKEVIDLLPGKHANSLGEVLFPALIEQGDVVAYITDKRFYDIGTPARITRAEQYFNALKKQE